MTYTVDFTVLQSGEQHPR